MAKNERMICVGEIVAAHGIKGEVKLKSFTDDPVALARYAPLSDENQARVFSFKMNSHNGDILIAAFKGVADRDAAEALRGTKLYVPRGNLPALKPRQFYYADLKGLTAVDAGGQPIGMITDVMNFGAGDIVAVECGSKEYLLPFKPPFVGDPDLKTGTVEVTLTADTPFSEKKPPKPKRKRTPRARKLKKPDAAPSVEST